MVLVDGAALTVQKITNTVGSINLSSAATLTQSAGGATSLRSGVDLVLSAGSGLNLANVPTVVRDYTITASSFGGQSLKPNFSPGRDFNVNTLASLTLNTNLTAPRNLTVNSAAALDTTSATLTATSGTLTLQGPTGLNVGATSATSGATNFVTTSGPLSLQGPVDATGQTLTLSSGAGITQNAAGTITASTVTGSAAGLAVLNNGSNLIGTLASFTDTAAGANLKVGDAQNLIVTGAVNLGPTGTLTLVSSGTISGDTATLTAGTFLSLSAGGASYNNAANAIATLGQVSDTGNGAVKVADGLAFTVTGPVNIGTGTLTLNSAGVISASGATITAGALSGSSVGDALFGNSANAIATLASFSTGPGSLTLADSKSLTVTGAQNIGALLTLNVAGSISANGATITAGTLTGSSAGGASFNNALNATGAFGPFSDSANGNVAFGDTLNVTVTGAVNVGTGTLTLNSTHGIFADSATITAGTLKGSANGTATFNNNTDAITTFGSFTDTGGAVTVADGQNLTVTGAVNIGTGTLTLTSTGTIAADTAAITAGTLTGSSVGAASFANGGNAIGAFGSFSSGPAGDVTLANGQNLIVTGAVNLGTGTLTLNSAGSIAGDTATITAATLTGSSAGGASFHNGANAIAAFQNFANTLSGDVVLANGGPLTVQTITNTAGSISLSSASTLTQSGGGGSSLASGVDLILSAGASLDLGDTPTVARDYVITAQSFLGHSLSPIFSPGRDFTVNSLSGFTLAAPLTATRNLTVTSNGVLDTSAVTVKATGGNLTLQGGTALNVGATTATSGKTTLTTTNGTIVLQAAVNATGQTLVLTSTGAIVQSAGTITAATVTGSSAAGATLNAPNAIGAFGPFTDTSGAAVSVANGHGLMVTGLVNLGLGTLTLTSTGPIAGDTATITAAALGGSSVGGASFNNVSNKIGAFSFSNTLSGDVVLADGLDLTANSISDPVGSVSLTTTGALFAPGGNPVAGLDLTLSAGTVLNLPSTPIVVRDYTITGQSFLGSALFPFFSPGRDFTVNAVGGFFVPTSLTAPRNLTVTSTGVLDTTGVSLAANSGSLILQGATGLNVGVTSATSGATHFATTTSGNIALLGTVNASGQSLTLTSAGAISQPAGGITASSVSGSSVTGATLTKANLFGTLAGFTNSGTGNVSITDAQASGLAVTGAVNAGAGNNLTLTTTNAGPLTLAASLGASGGTVDLISAGHISQMSGVIATGVLTGSSVNGASLTGANVLASLAGFTNVGVGNVSITDAGAATLNVTGAVDAGAGNTLTLTTSFAPMTLAANLTAAGGAVDLASAGSITQTGGIIGTATLTGSSVGGANLTDANLFDLLAGFTNTSGAAGPGNVSITDAQASGLTVTSGVDTGTGSTFTLTTTAGPLALTSSVIAVGGTVDLVSAGPISQSSVTITTSILTGSSVGGASLTSSGNAYDTLAGFTNTGVGAVSIFDSQPTGLTVTGPVDAGIGNTLTLREGGSGNLTLTANLSASGGTVDLISFGALTQSGGIITASALTGFAYGDVTLPRANLFDALAGFSGAGNVSITDAKATGLTVSGPSNAGTGKTLVLTTTNGGSLTLGSSLAATGGVVDLVSAGPLIQSGGNVATGALAGSSVGGASLTSVNFFDTLAGFTNTGGGGISVVDAQGSGLTVTGPVDAGIGNTLTLTTTNGGALTLAANLTASGGTVDLISANAISQTAGIITTATVTGSSVNGAGLTDANVFDSLAGFSNSGSGNLAVTDAKVAGLTVSAAVDAGSGNTVILTTTNGGPLTLAADVIASGGAVDLVSTGALTQMGGIITTPTLTGASGGGASLTAANLFDQLAGFAGTGVGAVSIIDARVTGLTVTGGVNAGTGNTLALTTTAGPMTLAANLTASGASIDLVSAGALSQTGGIITTATLTGASAGGASLIDGNLVLNLAGFTNTGAGNVSITGALAAGLNVTGAVDAGAGNTLTLATTGLGPLSLAANITAAGGTVALVSAGSQSQTSGVITTAILTGSSGGGAGLTGGNRFDLLAGFTNTGVGAVSITDAQATGLTVTAGVTVGTGNALTIDTSGGPLTLAANLTASGGSVDLVSAGALSQTGGTINTATLSGSSVGGASLTDANLFATLAGFSNTGFGVVSITDARAAGLTVTSAVDAGVGNALTLTTTSGGPLILAANLTAAGASVDLISAGSISQTGGFITTGVLTGSSVGGASLAKANLFDTLAGFTNTGAGAVSITDAQATGLTVNAPVDAGAGANLTLTTANAGPLILAANLSAVGGTVDLAVAGALTQTGGAITAATLTGSSAGGASLTGANLFDTLAGFTNTGVGAVSITDAQATGLTVTSAVDVGTVNTLTLTTAGPMTLAANLTAGGGTVDLISAGAISQTGGIITTSTLTGSSSGSASLARANLFDTLAGFANTGVGNVSITDAQATGLTVGAAVDAGAGDTLTLTTTSGGALTLAANLTAAGGTVDLVSAGALTQTSGIITAGTLTGSSVGGAGLTAANLFNVLAGFTNSGGGAVSITDAQAAGLTVIGAVDAGTGNTLILTTTNGAPLTLAANVSASGGTVDLTSAGALAQTAGIITTSSLTGSSVDGASLTNANVFDTLTGFTNAGFGDVSITDAGAATLNVTGAVDAGAGNTLTLTTSVAPMILAANLDAAGGGVDLISAGSISQTAGIITTSILTASSVGGASLTGANLFDVLAGFTNTGAGAVSITDVQTTGLMVGAVDAGTGNALTFSTTSGGALTLAGNLTVAGGTVHLVSAGVLSQSGGVITTATLTGTSVGGASLTGANAFANLAGFTNTGVGALSITDAAALTVMGAVDAGAGNTLTLTTTGPMTMAANLTAAGATVDLVSAGALTQTGGIITTATLTGSSAGAASLTRANLFDTLAGFTNTGVGAVSITEARASGLTVTSTVDAGAGNALTLTTTNGGPLTLAASLSAAGATVNLVSSGALSQTGGIITSASLTGSSVGGANLTAANLFGALAGFTNTGVGAVSISAARASGLTVSGAVDAGAGNTLTLTTTNGGPLTLVANLTAAGGAVDFVSAGPISQTSGIITTSILMAPSAGGATLTDANLFDTLGAFTNTGVGNVSITDAKATGLTVTGAADAGAGNHLTLTTTNGGSLTLAANLSAIGGMVDLVSAGPLSQTGGIIAAAALTGSSAGGASLTGANLFDALAGFTNAGAGATSITDAKATGLIVTAGVNAGAGNVLSLVTTGGPLTLAANLDAVGGTVDLVSAGALLQSGGLITTAVLTGSSGGGASLTDANLFASLAGFSNSGGGSVSITDVRTAGLTVTSAVDAGAGDALTLTTANGGPLTIAASLTASGGTVDLISAGALFQTAGVITTGVLTASAAGGATLANANQVASLGGFTNTGAGDITLTDAAASGLTVTAGVTVGAGHAVTLTTTGGPLTLAADLTAQGGSVALASSGAIDQTAGVITTGVLKGASAGGATLADANAVGALSGFVNLDPGAITFVNTGPLVVTGTVDNTLGTPGGAGRDIALAVTSGSLTGTGVFTAARDVALQAVSGSLSFASATAGDDLVLRAATGVGVAGPLAATGSASALDVADSSGAGKVLAAGSPVAIFGQAYASLTDGSHVDVQTGGGDITLGGATSAAADVRLQALSGAIHTQDISAGRTIVVDAAMSVDRGAAASNNLSAGVDVAVQAGNGAVTAGAVLAATGDVIVRSATGAVSLVSASAGDDLVVRAATGLTVAGSLSAGNAGDSAGLADAFLASQLSQAPAAFGHTYANLAGGSNIDVLSGGHVAVGGSTSANGSGSDVRVVATGADAGAAPALSLQGPVSAGQDVALDATGGIMGQSIRGSIAVGGAATAGRDVAARATAGSITLLSGSAGDDIVLAAPGGSVTLDGSLSATGAAVNGVGQTLFAKVSKPLNGLFTLGAQSIFVDAVSYANGGYGPVAPAGLIAGKAIGIALSDPTGLSLADAKLGAGSWIMASTLLAPTVSLFETKGDIDVGAATVNTPVTRLNLYTSDVVSVTGRFAPATDNTVNLTIGDLVQGAWTPSQIDVINDGGAGANAGSIGVTTVSAGGVYSSAPKTFDTAALYATTNILLGQQAFVTANAAITNIAMLKQIDPSRPVPAVDVNMSKAVMLAAGDLTLVAGSMIVQQNTSGLRTSNGTGYYVTRTLTLGAYAPYPPAIDLFGVFVTPGTTTAITGPAAADVNAIFLLGSLANSPYRALYRVNSCVIGELGNCTPTSDGIIDIPLDELSRGSLLSRDELDVEDPTITGAPNEEIWRRPDDRQ